MSVINKLLAVAALGRSIYGKWMMQRIIGVAILLMGAAIMLSILGSALVIAIFYAGYSTLIYYGLEPPMAFLAVLSVALLMILLMVRTIFGGLKRIHSMPGRLMKEKAPFLSEANEALEAFLAGLMGETSVKTKE